ncbi:hypothetical protein NL676_009994 [Syzygium grande]|nr:hypothetical protein NL676_009994 [Syzygium grande]
MAESVVSSVGQTIGKLLIDEAKFLWGMEGKVEDLQKELKLTQVAQKKGQNIIKAYACFVTKGTCVQARVVGIEIVRLKSSISNLKTSMQAYGIQMLKEGRREQARASTPRRTYAHFNEDFVGREDSIKELVKALLEDGKKNRVIFIWGMGGLGKTSLAKKVLGHYEVKNKFISFAWTCISQQYHIKDILVEILVQLTPDQTKEVKEMIDHQLFETLYKIQQEKRCIVVLDNFWTKEAWDSLRAAFPIENTKSKLLITTLNRDVAEYIDLQGLAVELSSVGLGVGQGITTSQAVKVITEHMKTIGDELLEKCGGLPLAIIMLGGLLAVNEWETVHKKINLHFSDKSGVLKVLALSYDDLPWHLKPCFPYLGSFPDDAEILAREVLHMWIAAGFVSFNAYDEEREIAMEDVAEQYLMDLVNKGMVRVQFSLSEKIKTCHLHDLIQIEKLPEHKNLPQQLRKLVLVESELKEDPMPILEKLQHLIVLMLGLSAFVGKEMDCSAGSFPQLKHFVLCYQPNLEWRVAEGAMPHLSRLGISGCPRLKTVPQGVHPYDGTQEFYRELLKAWGLGERYR